MGQILIHVANIRTNMKIDIIKPKEIINTNI